MPLHIDPEVRASFAAFYDFALEQKPPLAVLSDADASVQGAAPSAAQAQSKVPQLPVECVLTLEQLDDVALTKRIALLEQPQRITCVIVRGCPALQSLAPLAALSRLTCVGVWGCGQLRTLWSMEQQPLWGIALTDCKRLCALTQLAACANTLQHLFLQGRAWNAPCLTTLAPLPQMHALVTCDLAARKVSHSGIIYFDDCFAHLQALTITPKLAKYFRRAKD